jgi:Uma2 family endonuclease
LTELIEFDQLIYWYPDGYGRFELHDGVIIEMQPTGTNEQVSGFSPIKLGVQIEKNNLPYFISDNILLNV